MNEKILIAEDDPAILAGVRDLLEIEGYAVEEATDGVAALESFRNQQPDLVLLDVMMPKISGYEVCRAIRQENHFIPILMLTAKGEEIDKVIGLELGADDYIVKPFSIAELLARIRSAIRRGSLGKTLTDTADSSLLCLEDITVNFGSMTVHKSSENSSVSLTPKEAALLQLLTSNEGKVVSRETLLEHVWGIDCDITTRSVDQHMVRLRQKLEDDPANPRFLHTAYGIGYRFERTRRKSDT